MYESGKQRKIERWEDKIKLAFKPNNHLYWPQFTWASRWRQKVWNKNKLKRCEDENKTKDMNENKKD